MRTCWQEGRTDGGLFSRLLTVSFLERCLKFLPSSGLLSTLTILSAKLFTPNIPLSTVFPLFKVSCFQVATHKTLFSLPQPFSPACSIALLTDGVAGQKLDIMRCGIPGCAVYKNNSAQSVPPAAQSVPPTAQSVPPAVVAGLKVNVLDQTF